MFFTLGYDAKKYASILIISDFLYKKIVIKLSENITNYFTVTKFLKQIDLELLSFSVIDRQNTH